MMKTKVALLDVDGTLIDSNDAHAQAWIEAFAEHGREVAFDRVRALIGKGGDKLLPEAIHVEKDSPEGREIASRRSAIFKKTYLPQLRAFPDARALLARFKEIGLKLVVATSAQEDELDALLEQAGLGDLIERSATSSDAKDSKPDPDIVVAALRRAKCAPREAIMLGDTPYDMQASKRAGVASVALRCGGWTDDHFGDARAIYDDPHDLLLHLDSSPFAASHD
jgi:phosphoglycolate phosphatase-like HAD superfamily hydrolase